MDWMEDSSRSLTSSPPPHAEEDEGGGCCFFYRTTWRLRDSLSCSFFCLVFFCRSTFGSCCSLHGARARSLSLPTGRRLSGHECTIAIENFYLMPGIIFLVHSLFVLPLCNEAVMISPSSFKLPQACLSSNPSFPSKLLPSFLSSEPQPHNPPLQQQSPPPIPRPSQPHRISQRYQHPKIAKKTPRRP